MVELGSYIHTRGVEVNTRVAVSQKVRLFSFVPAGGSDPNNPINQIGVLTSFSPSESRNVETARGIGFGDRVAELVPGVTDAMSISVDRVALWLINVFQVFGYKSGVDGIIRSLRHHRWPFDIRQEMIFSEIAKTPSVLNPVGVTGNKTQVQIGGVNSDAGPNANTKALVTFYEGCWMNSYGTSFSADTAIVSENVGIQVSDVTAGPLDSDPEQYFADDSLQDKAFRVNP